MQLTVQVYKVTEQFPKHELYGLSQQLRRAAVSIASNISEGAGRQTNKEFVQFLYCALGSATEVETQIELAHMLEYLTNEQFQSIIEMRDRVGKMIYGLIKSVKK